jgi:hypothetical protein
VKGALIVYPSVVTLEDHGEGTYELIVVDGYGVMLSIVLPTVIAEGLLVTLAKLLRSSEAKAEEATE